MNPSMYLGFLIFIASALAVCWLVSLVVAWLDLRSEP